MITYAKVGFLPQFQISNLSLADIESFKALDKENYFKKQNQIQGA